MRARIFISYSHRGNGPEWKEWLLQHLSVFGQHHLLDVWQDGKIRVSKFWDDDIKQAMSDARLAVLLLTPEALESQYILETEFPILRERQQREKLPVIPVICEECNWRPHDWIRATQAPNKSNPLSKLPDAECDRVLRQLATDIANELSAAALSSLAPSEGERAGVRGQPETRTYLDKFPLTRGPGLREEKLIGREQELALLDLALASVPFALPMGEWSGVRASGAEESVASTASPPSGERAGVGDATAIVSLVAWGGVGKTMLVQYWLQRLQREGWFGARRVYAWSFYSQGTKEDRQASEDTFLLHALEWFGVQCEPTLSQWDKGRLLADAVARERTLLILDGIEPLQYPPGPMGGQLRAPGVQSLLKQLARRAKAEGRSQNAEGSNCLCLITTREPLTDLAHFQRREGSPWGSVLRVDLGNLTEEAGAALLHHAGANRAGAAEIKPDDKELLAASREVDGHALTLNLLGRFLHYAQRRDILQRNLVRFEEADREERGGTTFKMLATFENWFNRDSEIYKHQLTVLRILGLFDRPADAASIAALRKFPAIAGITDALFTTRPDQSSGLPTVQPIIDEEWNVATSWLCDFGLVTSFPEEQRALRGYDWEVLREVMEKNPVQTVRIPKPTDYPTRERAASEMLDVHPLIREYFTRQLRIGAPAASWKLAHRRLYDHLSEHAPGRIPYWPEGLEGLKRLYQAVMHGCNAGLHQEVCSQTYKRRILRGTGPYGFYSVKMLGAYDTDLAAIANFFDAPWAGPVRELEAEDRDWILTVASSHLRALGRLDEAVEPIQAVLDRRIECEDWTDASNIASSISELNLTLGSIANAVSQANASVVYADRSGDPILRVGYRTTLADALHQEGRRNDAWRLFQEAEALEAKFNPQFPILSTLQGFRFCDLILALAERVAWQLYLNPSALLILDPGILADCHEALRRAKLTLDGATQPLYRAFDHLSSGRARLYIGRLLGRREVEASITDAQEHLASAMTCFRKAGTKDEQPRALITHAWLRAMKDGKRAAQADLDEAWDIAERGPMRLHMADIHLYRARLFFREKPYPWKSPRDDLAAAEKLINDCGYHRRDEELTDAKRAILGT